MQILQTPLIVTPSDNPILYTFRMDYFPLKYKVSFIVKVNTSDKGEIGVFEIYPEKFDPYGSGYIYGKIDVSNIVRNYLGTIVIDPNQFNSNNIYGSGYNYDYVTIEVIEKYATTVNGTPTLHDSATSEQVTVFKGCLSDKEFLNFDPLNYNVGNIDKYYLTDKPKEPLYPGSSLYVYKYNFKREDSFNISYLDIAVLSSTQYDKYLRVSFWNGTSTTNINIDFLSGDQEVYNSININLKSFVAQGLITQNIADNTIMITFAVAKKSNDVSVTPIVYLLINDVCNYTGKSLKFANKFGAFDYFLFEHNERKSATIKQNEFQTINGAFNFYNQYIFDLKEGRKVYSKQITDKMQLISGYLTQNEQNWLVQLYESPQVYLNYGDNQVENVVVTNSNYTIKQDQYDDLYNEIVEIEFTTKNSIEL